MKCDDCGTPVSGSFDYCPECGEYQNQPRRPSKFSKVPGINTSGDVTSPFSLLISSIPVIVIGLLLLSVVGVMTPAAPEDTGQDNELMDNGQTTEPTEGNAMEDDADGSEETVEDFVLTIENEQGAPVEDAVVNLSNTGGIFAVDESHTERTDESGKVTYNAEYSSNEDELDVEVTHSDYFDYESTISSGTTTIQLTEFDAIEYARQTTEDILESETDEVRDIEVSESEDGLRVKARSNYKPFSASESEFNNKAADVLEGVFESDADIDYFEIDIYVPTTDEFGEEGQSRALTVGMSRDTANQINWDNYDSDNLPLHADKYNINYYLF